MASQIASASSLHHVLNLICGYRVSYGLFAALNHGIFEYLEKNGEGQTARQTAKDLTLDETATTVLLDTCASADLLVKDIPNGEMVNARYSNSEPTKRYLLQNSADTFYGYALHVARNASKITANFEHTVIEGTSQWERTFGLSSEKCFDNFYRKRDKLIEFGEAMHSMLKISMPSVLGPFNLSGFNHLCDLGGGGILIGGVILDDDKRGPALNVSNSIPMLSICPGGRERSGKEYEQLLTKHGFVDVQCHQNPIPCLLGGVFAKKP